MWMSAGKFYVPIGSGASVRRYGSCLCLSVGRKISNDVRYDRLTARRLRLSLVEWPLSGEAD